MCRRILFNQGGPLYCFHNSHDADGSGKNIDIDKLQFEFVVFDQDLHGLHEDWLLNHSFPIPAPVVVIDADKVGFRGQQILFHRFLTNRLPEECQHSFTALYLSFFTNNLKVKLSQFNIKIKLLTKN